MRHTASPRSSRRRAFTLVELLMVFAIIALLTGIVIFNLASARGKARDAERVGDLARLKSALSLYYGRCGQYPAYISAGLETSNGCPSGVNLGTFMDTMPLPPGSSDYSSQIPYGYMTKTQAAYSNGQNFVVDYILHAYMETSNPAIDSGLAEDKVPSWASSVSPRPFYCHDSSHPYDYCVTSK